MYNMPGREGKSRKKIIPLMLTVLLIYSLDQLSKYFVTGFLPYAESVRLFGNFLYLTRIHNTGAAFGIFKNGTIFFVIAAVVATFVIPCMIYFKRRELSRHEFLGLVFIFSGTLGNLTDRLRFGYVIDFIDLKVWPVFNIADSFISIGVVVLMIATFLKSREPEK